MNPEKMMIDNDRDDLVIAAGAMNLIDVRRVQLGRTYFVAADVNIFQIICKALLQVPGPVNTSVGNNTRSDHPADIQDHIHEKNSPYIDKAVDALKDAIGIADYVPIPREHAEG